MVGLSQNKQMKNKNKTYVLNNKGERKRKQKRKEGKKEGRERKRKRERE